MLKTLLEALALPLVKKVLAGLGFAVLTYSSTDAILSYFISELQGHLGGTSANVLQIVTLFGVPQSIGIIMGGWSTALGLQSLKKMGLI